MARILIIGGSKHTHVATEALARADLPGVSVSVYWSRGGRSGTALVAPDLRRALAGADAIVDTTHAFDSDLQDLARALAPDMPGLRFARPLWTAQAGDHWHDTASLGGAVALLGPGARVFAATGRDSAEILGHHDGRVFLRQLQRHDDAAPPNVTFVFGEGPFDPAGEVDLFANLRIDTVLARNIGGAGSYPKIEAAQRLGLPVVMIAPRPSPFGQAVHAPDALVAWVGGLG